MGEKVFFDIRPNLDQNLVSQILGQVFPDFGENFTWKLLQGGWENANILVKRETNRFVLRIYRFGKRRREDIEKELKVSDFFFQRGIPTTKVSQFDGSFLKTIQILGRPHQVAVFSYLPGRNLNPEEIDGEKIRQIAALLAKIHFLGKDYPFFKLMPKAVDLFWVRSEELNNLRQKRNDAVDSQLSKSLQVTLEKFKEILVEEKEETVLHNDFSRGNVFFEDGKVVGVLDWQEAIWGPAIWDIGKSISYFAVDADLTFPEVFRSFLEGYFGVRSRDRERYVISTGYFWCDMIGKIIETYPKEELKTDARFLKIVKLVNKEIAAII